MTFDAPDGRGDAVDLEKRCYVISWLWGKWVGRYVGEA
jgi:hypothetical protein